MKSKTEGWVHVVFGAICLVLMLGWLFRSAELIVFVESNRTTLINDIERAVENEGLSNEIKLERIKVALNSLESDIFNDLIFSIKNEDIEEFEKKEAELEFTYFSKLNPQYIDEYKKVRSVRLETVKDFTEYLSAFPTIMHSSYITFLTTLAMLMIPVIILVLFSDYILRRELDNEIINSLFSTLANPSHSFMFTFISSVFTFIFVYT